MPLLRCPAISIRQFLIMKKTYLLGAAAALVASSMPAAPITPEEALSRLGGSRFKAAGVPLKLVHTSYAETGEPSVYVFNRESPPVMLLQVPMTRLILCLAIQTMALSMPLTLLLRLNGGSVSIHAR